LPNYITELLHSGRQAVSQRGDRWVIKNNTKIYKNCCCDIALKNQHVYSSGQYHGKKIALWCCPAVALQLRNSSARAGQQLSDKIAQQLRNVIT